MDDHDLETVMVDWGLGMVYGLAECFGFTTWICGIRNSIDFGHCLRVDGIDDARDNDDAFLTMWWFIKRSSVKNMNQHVSFLDCVEEFVCMTCCVEKKRFFFWKNYPVVRVGGIRSCGYLFSSLNGELVGATNIGSQPMADCINFYGGYSAGRWLEFWQHSQDCGRVREKMFREGFY
jgi:hypothetical protein